MSSHVHFGAIAGELGIEPFFRSVHTRFAQYFHRRYHGLGPVFADRPKNFRIRPAALANVVAYHHMNPVRAGVVCRARDSTWTSHRIYMRLEPEPEWLDVEFGLAKMGFKDTPSGRAEFDDFVNDCQFAEQLYLDQVPDVPLSDELEGQRERDLTDEEFADVVTLVALSYEVHPMEILSPVRPRERDARMVVAVAARHIFNASYADIGHRLGMSRQAAFKLVTERPEKLVYSALEARLEIIRDYVLQKTLDASEFHYRREIASNKWDRPRADDVWRSSESSASSGLEGPMDDDTLNDGPRPPTAFGAGTIDSCDETLPGGPRSAGDSASADIETLDSIDIVCDD